MGTFVDFIADVWLLYTAQFAPVPFGDPYLALATLPAVAITAGLVIWNKFHG